MGKEELFAAFTKLFPDWVKKVVTYKKIGSKCLAITFLDEEKGPKYSRVFLYVDPNNWQFGTKLWRKRPERLKKSRKDHLLL